MTSDSNKLLPLIKEPKPRIGTQRPPNRRDLFDRRDPHTGARLELPPDPGPEVALHRAELELGQTTIHMQQTIIDMNPDSAVRDSLTVLEDPEAASWSDPEWETITDDSTDSEAEREEAIEIAIVDALRADLEEESEEGVEDAFIAKVRGVGADEVRRERGRGMLNPVQRLVRKVKAVGERGPIVAGPEPTPASVPARTGKRRRAQSPAPAPASAPAPTPASAPAPTPEPARRGKRRRASSPAPAPTPEPGRTGKRRRARSPAPTPAPEPPRRRTRAPVPTRAPAGTRSRPPAPQAPPILTNAQPGSTAEMTAAEAALVLTNQQAGTQVIMEELRATGEIDDLDYSTDTYHWTVGGVGTRELTVAEAALAMTNMQAGTRVTMDDLRTSREMVDLWDCEDTFTWTVGNVE